MDISKYINDNLDEIIDNPDFLLDNPNLLKIPNIKENKDFDNDDENEFDNDDENEFDNDDENEFEEKSNYKLENELNEPNEDNYQDDIESELYQDMYEKILINHNKDNLKSNKSEIKDEESDEEEINETIVKEKEMEYYINLMNIYMKYYNEKFNKTDNFFSGIKDYQKDTSNPMELFYEAIFEFEQFKKILFEDFKEDLKDNLDLDDTNIINNLANKFIFNENDSDKIEHLFQTWKYQIYCLSLANKKYFSPSLIVCLNYINANNLINELWNIFNLRDN